jgi:tripartite-type tricarboxylate transporter receptor subunit TctC
MTLARRKFLQLAGATAALLPTSSLATAQTTYPTRPITLIVPFPPGGTTDVIARLIAEPMRAYMGQPIVIENIGGADGNIGTGRAARAQPDGYTLCLGVMDTHVLNAGFYSLPYDVFDFAPIAPLAANWIVFYGRKSIPAKDLSELISWLKARPFQASAGTNSLGLRLFAESFQRQTGTQFTIVPYRGGNNMQADFLGGQIDLFVGFPRGLTLFPEKITRAYAVASDARLTFAPEIPTFAELGLPSLVYSGWYGLFAPKGTPKDIIVKLNAAAVHALANQAVRSRLLELGYEIAWRESQTPEALAALQKADAEKWWPIIKQLGIKPVVASPKGP